MNYTVIMIQWMQGEQIVMGSKTMSQTELDILLSHGATLLYKEPKHGRIVSVIMN